MSYCLIGTLAIALNACGGGTVDASNTNTSTTDPQSAPATRSINVTASADQVKLNVNAALPKSPSALLSGETIAVNAPNTPSTVAVVYPEDFGASGSIATLKCSIDSGSNKLRCSGAGDFKVGEGILIHGAGGFPHGGEIPQPKGNNPPRTQARDCGDSTEDLEVQKSLNPYPPYNVAPTIIQRAKKGAMTTGTHSYCYKVAVFDHWHGIQSPSKASCINNEAELDYDNLNNGLCLNDYLSSNPRGKRGMNYLWYVSKDGGPYRLLTVSIARTLTTDFADTGFVGANGSSGGWPDPLPDHMPSNFLSMRDMYSVVSAIRSLGGGVEIELKDDAASDASNVIVEHDDTLAVQRSIEQVGLLGGGTLQFSAKPYNIKRPAFTTFNPGNKYALDETNEVGWWTLPIKLHASYVHPDNLTISGAIDTLGNQTTLYPGVDDLSALFDIASPKFVGAVNDVPIFHPEYRIPIYPANKGANKVILKNLSDLKYLSVGDDLLMVTGNFATGWPTSDNIAKGVFRSNIRSSDYYAEPDRIVSIDADSGTLTLERALTKKLWDDGYDFFGFIKIPGHLLKGLTFKNLMIQAPVHVFSTAPNYDLTIDNVTIQGVSSPPVWGAGYWRGATIKNSRWKFGSTANRTVYVPHAWSGNEEFDKFSELTLDNNDVSGFYIPLKGVEDTTAHLYLTEGTTKLSIVNNRFDHVTISVQNGDDVVVSGNDFEDSVIEVGGCAVNPMGAYMPGDWATASFDSQNTLNISNNKFIISNTWPGAVINIGDYANGTIFGNVISYQNKFTSRQVERIIYADAGLISGNSIDLKLNANNVDAKTMFPAIATSRCQTSHPLVQKNNVLNKINVFDSQIYRR